MKNLISLIVLTLVLCCCSKKEEEEPINPISELPPATQTGANTAGCLVNGKVFLPRGSNESLPIMQNLNSFYEQNQLGFSLGLNIVEKNPSENKIVIISLNPNQLFENTTYNLVAKINGSSNYISNFAQFAIYKPNSVTEYITTATNTGEIRITKLNTQQRIMSGTFWYDAINSQGEVVKIREGRFDVHYEN